MKLLVGIPTHRRPALLRECLESVARQQGDLPDIEVFVADNHPAGREGAAVVEDMKASYRFPISVEVVPTPGISAVRNAILDQARRRGVDYVAMIDDDETASPEWLSNLLKMLQSTSADVVGGPVHYRFDTPPAPSVLNSPIFLKEARPNGRCGPLRGSGNFLVAANSLAETGWPMFDNDFGLSGGEDGEWFSRLARLGLNFAWAPDAAATEKVPSERATPQWVLQRAYRAGNCNMRIAIKHWPSREIVDNLGHVALTVGSAPFLAPLLFVRNRRLRLLTKWWAAFGRVSAIIGRDFHEYAERHAEP